MNATPFQLLLSKLPDAKKKGKGWSARCPAHDDRRPSLTISEGDDGRALVTCHAGCTVDAICSAVGLRLADLMVDDPSTSTKPRQSRKKQQYRRQENAKPSVKTFPSARDAVAALDALMAKEQGQRVSQWTYHDVHGVPVGVVARYDLPTPEGEKQEKSFRPVARHGDRWMIGGMAEPRPLYRLPDLAGAKRVYIVEGENCAEHARSIGLIATTSPHGAKSANLADWRPLAGKECVIVPDNDEAGRKYADAVASILAKLKPPPVVNVVDLPDLPDHGDLVDWIEAHGDAAKPDELRRQLDESADKAETIKPTGPENRIKQFEPFPTDALPEPIRGFVEAGAKAIGCDPSYLALPMLTAVAAAIGHTRRLRLKRTWTCSATLWAAVIGESGDKKSPPMELALQPFERREFDAGEEHERNIEQFQRDMANWKKEYKAWENDKKATDEAPEQPKAPIAERYLIDDATTEGVPPILRDNPRGVLLYKDELKTWFGSFDRYVTKKGGDDGFWLKVFNNKLIIVDRKTLATTTRIRRPFVCIIGGIQPGTLKRVLGVEHLESGMAARLLLAWPPSRPRKWTEAELSKRIEDAVSDLIDRLFTLVPELDENARPSPVLIWPTERARKMFIRYFNAHADEMAELSGELKAAWSKLEEYAARLALVIHFARWAAGDPTLEDECKVDEASMIAGIRLTEWFKNEARRVYAMLSESDEDRERRRLIEWIERKGGSVNVRDVQIGHRQYGTPEEAEEALSDLGRAGHGDWEPVPTTSKGGRPSRKFNLHRPSAVYETIDTADESNGCVDVNNVDTSETQSDDEWGEL